MFRIILPTAFAAMIAIPALAQQADTTPAAPKPEAQAAPDAATPAPAPMPILPAQGSNCGSTKQMTS